MSVDLRVVTWNVRSLRDDADLVAATLRDLRPDVVCLQEAPRFLRWRSRCADLAREAQLLMVGGGRDCGANVVLASLRTQVAGVVECRLPGSATRHRRGVAMGVLEVAGARVLVAGTHLSLDAVEREVQAREAVRRIASLGEANVVLCGDFNDVPGSRTWQALSETLRDAHSVAPVGDVFTFPAGAPARRLDAVFVSAALEVVGAGVPADLPNPAAASDHLPVVADLRLG